MLIVLADQRREVVKVAADSPTEAVAVSFRYPLVISAWILCCIDREPITPLVRFA